MASYEPRGKSIRAIVRTPGGGKKTATFDTMAKAKAWGQAMERKKEIGELTTAADGITNGELFETYLNEV